MDARIILLGNEGSGKSTLVSVLISGARDDGRGMMRKKIMKNMHELRLGRTTTVNHHILGFDSEGNVTNFNRIGNNSIDNIVDDSSKIITFIDIGGRYCNSSRLARGLCS